MATRDSGIPQESFERIIEMLRSEPLILSATLFGSRAKGTFREGSDIDIAVSGPGITPSLRLSLLSQYDNLYLPWKLDLVIYDQITEIALKEHIDRVGVRIF